MRNTRILSPALLVAAALFASGVSGCSSGAASSVDEGIDFEEAKARTLEIETRIASYIPEENVKHASQNQTSKVLISCLGKDGYSYWPGTTNISLQGEFNEEAIIATIASRFSAQPEWTIERLPDQEGTPSLVLTSDQGYSFVADYFGGPSFTIKSQSACFPSKQLSGLSEY